MKKNIFTFLVMLLGLSTVSFAQDTIVDLSVVGKSLAIEYDNNTFKYLEQIRKVKPESYIIGRDYNGKRVLVNYDLIEVRTSSTGVLTLTGNLSDGDQVVVGSKTYTAQATLTDVDGNFHIGASASVTIDNLIYAITLVGGVEGVDYAASMTINSDVTAAAGAGDTMDVTAKIKGTSGDSIATTETSANASFGGATLSGGQNNGKLDLVSIVNSFYSAF